MNATGYTPEEPIAAIATALGLMNIHKVKAYDIRGGIL